MIFIFKTIGIISMAAITAIFFICALPFMFLFSGLRAFIRWIRSFFKPRDPTGNSGGAALYIDDTFLIHALNKKQWN